MKSQAYRMAMLYDFYGDVLTDRQKEFYDLYYNEDLSLARLLRTMASPARESGMLSSGPRPSSPSWRTRPA